MWLTSSEINWEGWRVLASIHQRKMMAYGLHPSYKLTGQQWKAADFSHHNIASQLQSLIAETKSQDKKLFCNLKR